MMITIYHKPTCQKSCQALALLKKKKEHFTVVEYVKTPPSPIELKNILKKLGMKAEQLVRKKEKLYKEKFEGKKISEPQWIKILTNNPILIERPIVIKGNKAVIGRPTERLLELL